ncbi:MAG: TetR/AcrR family transcriptional regulator [Actinobacteria bacterium]|nr:TetR/AcrR family transcriptional regulator [Actinomycetota bacterium]
MVRLESSRSEPTRAIRLAPAKIGKGERTRQAILNAAIVRFGRDGYRATSIADIARDASVGPTVPFAYFANKEVLFLSAADEDAAALVQAALEVVSVEPISTWPTKLFTTLIAALEDRPLARRLLAGLEPEVTGRVLDIPALSELRKACERRLAEDQLAGKVRSDLEASALANGAVTIMLSLLMSVVQLGGDLIARYGNDVSAFFDAALVQGR